MQYIAENDNIVKPKKITVEQSLDSTSNMIGEVNSVGKKIEDRFPTIIYHGTSCSWHV